MKHQMLGSPSGYILRPISKMSTSEKKSYIIFLIPRDLNYNLRFASSLVFLNFRELMGELSAPEIEGIYETQMSLEFRLLVQLGCICSVDQKEARR